ncbi:MAG: hypothetical protein FWH35_00120 [Treponema sp.]|nr:hypothetical protein [Treponema sp.]
MDNIFIFDDISGLQDHVIRDVLGKVNIDELTKALIREDEKIRKLFYKNMALVDLKTLDISLKTTEAFTRHEKRLAQKKILDIIAEIPEYHDVRFEHGFLGVEEFEKYLLERQKPEKKYGIFDKDVTMLRFFDAKDGDKVLADIKSKNESENMGNIKIPKTNIELINYSICPKCRHVFSFKDISDYYLNPKPDPLFKNQTQQYREDTRLFCKECETYFLPALVIVDGTPKNEVQFLCRIQTMNAIEDFYQNKGIKVLSRKPENIINKDVKKITETVQNVNPSIIDRLFKPNLPEKKTSRKITKKTVTGIRNDVLIKEMGEKPTLITNLIQYTPANIVLNLIEGTNYKKKDFLFGNFQ